MRKVAAGMPPGPERELIERSISTLDGDFIWEEWEERESFEPSTKLTQEEFRDWMETNRDLEHSPDAELPL